MASSASSSSPSASAFSSQLWNHDVFLSFKGEDTRKTFVDHLYSTLVLQEIHTYKDDETLRPGELIDTSLMKAIQESHIAVIIFSVNYADSSWCLNEVAHIMKCKDMTGQIVMPIFYDVDPSTVQKGKCGEAFAKNKLENKNKVEYWKKTLVDASNISGWELKNITNGHESKAIQEIVNKISSRLQLVTTNANETNRTTYACGLLVGSSLCDKNLDQWRSANGKRCNCIFMKAGKRWGFYCILP